ncbi:MAG TPA: hypothetical protein P5514_01325 [Bacteroidales bacterium]|nr:hypothetical protein [Bacteroidales bacterium]HRX95557.1 hypothetical protein [Bacteroidales bacterium]
MSYSIQIDHNNKLIHYRHSGNITAIDIGVAWQEFLLLDEFTQKKYNLFSDYREARFLMHDKDISAICDFLLNLKDILYQKKQAIVISEPLSTAISILFTGEVIDRVGFDVKVFSTECAAFGWLTQ